MKHKKIFVSNINMEISIQIGNHFNSSLGQFFFNQKRGMFHALKPQTLSSITGQLSLQITRQNIVHNITNSKNYNHVFSQQTKRIQIRFKPNKQNKVAKSKQLKPHTICFIIGLEIFLLQITSGLVHNRTNSKQKFIIKATQIQQVRVQGPRKAKIQRSRNSLPSPTSSITNQEFKPNKGLKTLSYHWPKDIIANHKPKSGSQTRKNRIVQASQIRILSLARRKTFANHNTKLGSQQTN